MMTGLDDDTLSKFRFERKRESLYRTTRLTLGCKAILMIIEKYTNTRSIIMPVRESEIMMNNPGN